MSDSTIVISEQHLYQTIVQFDKTIVLPRKIATVNIHDYLFCYCPLVGILFEVLRIFMVLLQISLLGVILEYIKSINPIIYIQISCTILLEIYPLFLSLLWLLVYG